MATTTLGTHIAHIKTHTLQPPAGHTPTLHECVRAHTHTHSAFTPTLHTYTHAHTLEARILLGQKTAYSQPCGIGLALALGQGP